MKIPYILSGLFLFLTSCDDGDIIVTNFDFEDATLQLCNTETQTVFFKLNSNINESISLVLENNNDLFIISGDEEYALNGSSNVVNYRLFDDVITADYFCNPVPPASPNSIQEYVGTAGTVLLNSVTTLDDNDGIETVASENDMEEGTGDLDEDGIPNFYDQDDDGDNVLTSLEIGDDPENPKDTDNDGIPNYLDMDDDGDGVLTRYEDKDKDLNPANDSTDPEVGPDYLNVAISLETVVDEYKDHTYNRTSDGTISISNLVLVNENETINIELFEFGNSVGIRNETITVSEFPEF